jgi:hypothetical protein
MEHGTTTNSVVNCNRIGECDLEEDTRTHFQQDKALQEWKASENTLLIFQLKETVILILPHQIIIF